MKSVYCAVRTGSLNKAVCASSLNSKLRNEKQQEDNTKGNNSTSPYPANRVLLDKLIAARQTGLRLLRSQQCGDVVIMCLRDPFLSHTISSVSTLLRIGPLCEMRLFRLSVISPPSLSKFCVSTSNQIITAHFLNV